jgi:hypothetical protein
MRQLIGSLAQFRDIENEAIEAACLSSSPEGYAHYMRTAADWRRLIQDIEDAATPQKACQAPAAPEGAA